MKITRPLPEAPPFEGPGILNRHERSAYCSLIGEKALRAVEDRVVARHHGENPCAFDQASSRRTSIAKWKCLGSIAAMGAVFGLGLLDPGHALAASAGAVPFGMLIGELIQKKGERTLMQNQEELRHEIRTAVLREDDEQLFRQLDAKKSGKPKP
jgi:hypothetical protein